MRSLESIPRNTIVSLVAGLLQEGLRKHCMDEEPPFSGCLPPTSGNVVLHAALGGSKDK